MMDIDIQRQFSDVNVVVKYMYERSVTELNVLEIFRRPSVVDIYPPLNVNDFGLISELLERGEIVPLSVKRTTNRAELSQLKLFDSVNWGMDGRSGHAVIYDLDLTGKEDTVISTHEDPAYKAAIRLLIKRIEEAETYYDSAFKTSGGRIVSPILVDPGQVSLKKRQAALKLG